MLARPTLLLSSFCVVTAATVALNCAEAVAAEPAVEAPVTTLPQEIPVAPGNFPLLNPAPAPLDAPINSAGTSPVTSSDATVIMPAAEPGQAPVLLTPQRVQIGCSLRDYGAPVARGQLASAIYNTCSGFSLHKPTFLLPFTYSPRYKGRETEFVFQFSAKVQLWDYGPGSIYFGYTQKSFFQVYNTTDSKPFRENNFNPEVFTRIPKPFSFLPNWSFDLGAEHESNGNELPDSRSYNRIYFQPSWTRGRELWQLKTWYRLPEQRSREASDPRRDDNPDLSDYTGYAELRYRRDFPWRNSLLDVMVRANTVSGRGAIQADYSVEIGPLGAVFIRVFNGYAESLIDYNRSVTRVGIGVALQR